MTKHPPGEDRMRSPSAVPRRVTSTSLTELLDLSPDAMIVIDQAGTIMMANEQLASLFGYRQEEVLGQLMEGLLPERLRAVHVTHRQRYFAAPSVRPMGTHLDLVGQRQNGSEFPVDISLRPVMLDDMLLAIGAVRDRSEPWLAERERAEQLAMEAVHDMNEPWLAERERAELAERLRLQAELIELAHDAILVRDTANRIIFWNRGAEELYGWSEEEASGRITHSLFRTVFPTIRAQVDEQLEREGRWEGELVHTCRDGRIVVVESRQALLWNAGAQLSAILEINRDITRRRQLEQVAQAEHAQTVARLAFLQQLLDELPSSTYLVYGNEARLWLANRAAQSLWGARWLPDQPMQEFLEHAGIRVFTTQGQLLAFEEFATLRAVRRGEAVLHQQETIRRPDGSLLPVQVNAVPIEAPVDWTSLQGENERAEKHPTLGPGDTVALVVHQDLSVLKEAEYLKDEFIGMAAHELRNPLAALKGFSNMLAYHTERGKGPELAVWQREAIGEIEQATARLDKLTEDLLDVTRLQAGRLVLSRKPTDLVSLARQQVQQTQMTTKRHTLSFETSLSSLVMEIDRGRIEQVLSNLLGNAVKYSPQGGPIEVVLRVQAEQSVGLLSVRDRGIGIPDKEQARLFGRFVRAENARTTEITGTGLGLYLSREFVERHGGQLWFESAEGVGSTFYLLLPLP